MFTINYTTFNSIKKSVSVIDEDYARTIFWALVQAIDSKTVDMIDGFTGEVIMGWSGGKFTVVDGRVV